MDLNLAKGRASGVADVVVPDDSDVVVDSLAGGPDVGVDIDLGSDVVGHEVIGASRSTICTGKEK